MKLKNNYIRKKCCAFDLSDVIFRASHEDEEASDAYLRAVVEMFTKYVKSYARRRVRTKAFRSPSEKFIEI